MVPTLSPLSYKGQHPQAHRWTLNEYLAVTSVFGDKRVELIDGEIIDMAPQGNPHSVSVSKLRYEFFRAFGDRHAMRGQSTLKLSEDTVPEPDFAVFQGELDAYDTAEPEAADVLLLVEVADTSLAIDQRKASIYARSAIPEYWIVDVNGRQLHVYLDPAVTGEEAEYLRHLVLNASDAISPQFAPQVSFTLASFLPQTGN